MFANMLLRACMVTTFLAGSMLYSQSSSGTISGHIVDPANRAVPAAEITLTNQATLDIRALKTNESGGFVFTAVQPGTFRLAVRAPGFKEYIKRDLILTSSERIDVGDLRIDIGATNQSVDVTAVLGTVETASSERSAVIESKQITELMARGRDIVSLLQILPGAVNDVPGNETLNWIDTPTVNGVARENNGVNIDGISANAGSGRHGATTVNMDAIAEVKILTNSYPAEYGKASGAIINVITKGGSREFHGGAYYYNRNEAFNANTFFNNLQGLPLQRYRYNTVGWNLGGPLYWPKKFNQNKDKLFFFISQEILPNQFPNAVRSYTVPTQLERDGNFSQSLNTGGQLIVIKDPESGQPFPGNVVPSSRRSINSAKLLSVFPLPNQTNRAVTGGNFNYQVAGTEDNPARQEILRVDYNISPKTRLWLRGTEYMNEEIGLTIPGISSPGQWGPAPVSYKTVGSSVGGNLTYIVSPTLINETTIGMTLQKERQLLPQSSLAAYQRQTYGINIPQSYPETNPLGLLPSMSFGGVPNAARINHNARFPLKVDSDSNTYSDTLTKIWRNHMFKGGLQIEWTQVKSFHHAGSANFPGNFDFQTNAANPLDSGYAYANAFLGNYYSYAETTARMDYQPVTPIFEWFVQDSWKVTRRLTLDIGLRFTWALPQTTTDNTAANFVPYLWDRTKTPVLYRPVLNAQRQRVAQNPITGQVLPAIYIGLLVPNSGDLVNGIVVAGAKGWPNSLVFSRGVLPGPRIGFAWDPFGNGKTAIRGGGGIFYQPRLIHTVLGNLAFNPPLIFNPTSYYGTVDTVENTTGNLPPGSLNQSLDPHSKNVAIYHLSFGVQRNVGFDTVLDVAYVGSLGRHLARTVQLNTVPYGSQFLPQNQDPSRPGNPLPDNFFRPYPGYGNIPYMTNDANSSYHSLQSQVKRRFSRGLQFGASWTWAKNMGYTGAATYNSWPVWNYGKLDVDRTHVFTLHYLWDIPKLSQIKSNKITRSVFDGWQLSGITSFISGQPTGVSISASPTVNFTGGGDGARPIMIANPVLPKSERTFYRYCNTDAFAEPAIGDRGNAPVEVFRGPGVNNWNTSLFKNFKVSERLSFQLRGEAYNTFNHTQFSAVNTSLQFNAQGKQINAQAGRLTAARDSRIIQVALRVRF